MTELSHGPKIRDRVWLLISALVQYANNEIDPEDTLRLRKKLGWRNGDRTTHEIVATQINKHDLVKLTRIKEPDGGLIDREVSESLKSLEELDKLLPNLEIFKDNRASQTGGTGNRPFTLKLWFSEPTVEREREFKARWAECYHSPSVLPKAEPEAEPTDTPQDPANSAKQVNHGDQIHINTQVTHNHGTVIPYSPGNITINQNHL